MIVNRKHLQGKTKIIEKEIINLEERLDAMGISLVLFPHKDRDKIKALPFGGNPRQFRDWNEYHLKECKLELYEGNIFKTKKKTKKTSSDDSI